jgi:hypothetical protein
MSRRLFRRGPSWRAGLVKIRCNSCARPLDFAQPEFVAAHPEPVCGRCGPRTRNTVRAVVSAKAEVLAIEAPTPINTAFERAVAQAEEVQR